MANETKMYNTYEADFYGQKVLNIFDTFVSKVTGGHVSENQDKNMLFVWKAAIKKVFYIINSDSQEEEIEAKIIVLLTNEEINKAIYNVNINNATISNELLNDIVARLYYKNLGAQFAAIGIIDKLLTPNYENCKIWFETLIHIIQMQDTITKWYKKFLFIYISIIEYIQKVNTNISMDRAMFIAKNIMYSSLSNHFYKNEKDKLNFIKAINNIKNINNEEMEIVIDSIIKSIDDYITIIGVYNYDFSVASIIEELIN